MSLQLTHPHSAEKNKLDTPVPDLEELACELSVALHNAWSYEFVLTLDGGLIIRLQPTGGVVRQFTEVTVHSRMVRKAWVVAAREGVRYRRINRVITDSQLVAVP